MFLLLGLSLTWWNRDAALSLEKMRAFPHWSRPCSAVGKRSVAFPLDYLVKFRQVHTQSVPSGPLGHDEETRTRLGRRADFTYNILGVTCFPIPSSRHRVEESPFASERSEKIDDHWTGDGSGTLLRAPPGRKKSWLRLTIRIAKHPKAKRHQKLKL